MTIQDYVETFYPKQYANGKWGCCLIGIDGETVKSLSNSHPHGFMVYLSSKSLVEKKYWVWLNKD